MEPENINLPESLQEFYIGTNNIAVIQVFWSIHSMGIGGIL